MLDEALILDALRGNQTVTAVLEAAGLTVEQFRQERDAFLRRRLPPTETRVIGGVKGRVEVLRDRFGVPHIFAEETPDLFYGLGLAMAQDRLWQMDFFRRRGDGRLSEILGEKYLASDLTHRTIGLDRIASREAELIDEGTRSILEAFVGGINRAIDLAGTNLPIEFEILRYHPEPWRVRDVVVALRGFWWSLNGRLQSIVAGEAASHLPEGPLRDAFLTPELPDERIVPPGSPYPPPDLMPSLPPRGESLLAGSDDGVTGSNNWAVAGQRTRDGAGVLGSDPHQPFMLPSNWYECRLRGPDDDAVGAAWAGVPGIWFGRNRRVAWGLTNNNASLRDLYVEEVDPRSPLRYRDGDTWREFVAHEETIAVRGGPNHLLSVRETVRGPIVNQLVPSVDPSGDPPLSLRWVGQEHLDDVRSLLAVERAQDWQQFRTALAGWSIPTFNWGYADVDGHVGYQCASRMPLRGRVARGLRDANKPEDRWIGYLPFDAMPRLEEPGQGFISSANNASVPDDYPYPLYGALGSGARAIRIRETIEKNLSFDRFACIALQNDSQSVRAREACPSLLRRLAESTDPDVTFFRGQIEGWDYRYETLATAPTFFEAFFHVWKSRVAAERFPSHLVPLVAGQGDLVIRLLRDDDLDWFHGDKSAAILESARQAVADVKAHFGADASGWAWGAVHLVHPRHPLSNDANADVFDVGPVGVAGSYDTVRNTGLGAHPPFSADSGAEYRLVVDLADPNRIWATQNLGQSGQPGSPHYSDQFPDWVRGAYHEVTLDGDVVQSEQTAYLRLDPV